MGDNRTRTGREGFSKQVVGRTALKIISKNRFRKERERKKIKTKVTRSFSVAKKKSRENNRRNTIKMKNGRARSLKLSAEEEIPTRPILQDELQRRERPSAEAKKEREIESGRSVRERGVGIAKRK